MRTQIEPIVLRHLTDLFELHGGNKACFQLNTDTLEIWPVEDKKRIETWAIVATKPSEHSDVAPRKVLLTNFSGDEKHFLAQGCFAGSGSYADYNCRLIPKSQRTDHLREVSTVIEQMHKHFC